MKRTFRTEYQKPADVSVEFGEPESDLSEMHTFEHETATKSVNKDVVLTLQSDLQEKIDAHAKEYGDRPDIVVLGEHEYAILDAFLQAEYGDSIKNGFEGAEVVTVPGRMVHVPKPHGHAIWDEVAGDE